jgi:hypothetical protein
MFGVSNLPDGRQAGLGHFDFSSIDERIFFNSFAS